MLNIEHERDMMLALKDTIYSVELLDSLDYENRTILVLPYAEYGDAESYTVGNKDVSDGSLKSFQYRLIYEIAHGIKEMHDKGICHLDIKSGNVLLFQNPNDALADKPLSQLADFGFASYTDKVPKGYVFGAPIYHSPEIARILIDAETDSHRFMDASMLDCKKVCFYQGLYLSSTSGRWEFCSTSLSIVFGQCLTRSPTLSPSCMLR